MHPDEPRRVTALHSLRDPDARGREVGRPAAARDADGQVLSRGQPGVPRGLVAGRASGDLRRERDRRVAGVIGSVTEAQAQMAEIGKRRKRRGDAGRTADEPAVSDAHVAAVAGVDALNDLPESKAVHTGPEPAMPVQSGEISGPEFRRGALAEGHAAESPQSGPPCGYPVPEGQPAPGVFDRGYLTVGQAADSPANN